MAAFSVKIYFSKTFTVASVNVLIVKSPRYAEACLFVYIIPQKIIFIRTSIGDNGGHNGKSGLANNEWWIVKWLTCE